MELRLVLGELARRDRPRRTGGPGALFWIIVTAIFGMSSKLASCTLAIIYRNIDPDGRVNGGPMYYLEKGLELRGLKPLGRTLAMLFAVLCIGGALGGGNMFQSNQTVEALGVVSPVFKTYNWLFGLILAALVGAVIIGGIQRIASVTSRLVPTMCLLYVASALFIIVGNIGEVPAMFVLIFSEAFSGQAVEGGVLGIAIIGITRAAFSNEAGIGSAAIAHSAAKTEEAAREGIVAMIGPFIDTIVICTMTALVILTVEGDFTYQGQAVQHVWQSDLGTTQMSGFVTTSGAFAAAFPTLIAGIPLGTLVASVALILFVFTTLLTWSYYGERAITFLYDRIPGSTRGGEKILHIIWRVIWCIGIFVGATQPSQLVWRLGDISNAAMALPNLLALALLSGVVFKLAKGERDAGPTHTEDTPEEPEEY